MTQPKHSSESREVEKTPPHTPPVTSPPVYVAPPLPPQPPPTYTLAKVVDLGKQSAKKIKKLKNHKGDLMDEVHAAVAEGVQSIPEASGARVIAVVVIYRKKPGKSKGGLPGLPFRLPMPF